MSDYREMTVAHLRDQKGADEVEVLFLESARIYKLPKNNPGYAELMKLLRDASAKGRAVKVCFAAPESDVIEDVQRA